MAEAFFGFEDAYDAYMLERMAIERDETLSDRERQARLDLLQADWPEQVREAMWATQAPATVSQQVQAMREQGASEAEIRALREQHFGAEATERLSALDQQRAEWDGRYQAYRSELRALASRYEDADTLASARERLRAEHFSEQEIRRVEALDRIAEQAN